MILTIHAEANVESRGDADRFGIKAEKLLRLISSHYATT